MLGAQVGKTRSGKTIRVHEILAEVRRTGYSAEDHFDAFAVFEYLVVRERKRHGENSDWYLKYYENAAFHKELLGDEQIGKCASNAGLRGVFKVRDFGRGLVRVEYRDL